MQRDNLQCFRGPDEDFFETNLSLFEEQCFLLKPHVLHNYRLLTLSLKALYHALCCPLWMLNRFIYIHSC